MKTVRYTVLALLFLILVAIVGYAAFSMFADYFKPLEWCWTCPNTRIERDIALYLGGVLSAIFLMIVWAILWSIPED